MKDKVFEILNKKKAVFRHDIKECIRELEKLKDEVKVGPDKDVFHITLTKFPALQTKLVSSRVALETLIEIEQEINRLGEREN